MPFVVKATSRAGNVYWLSVLLEDGVNTLALSHPSVFETDEEARAVIAKMPEAFANAGIAFEIIPHVAPAGDS